MSQLPEGWTAARLEEIVPHDAIISDGDWVESKDQDPTGNVRLIQLADIGDGDFKDKSQRFMNEEAASRLNCSYLSKGDLLVARMPDPLGRACLFPGVGQKAVTVVDVCFIQEKILSALSNKLLMHWINSPIIRGEISANASGSTRKRITRKKLEKFSFPIPPLAEQTRIVEKLDEVLAQVDTIKARLDGIPAILKRFRQSVLAAAVSGKLTEEWRSGTQYSVSVVCEENNEGYEFETPKNWLLTAFGNLSKFQQGLQIAKSSRRTELDDDVLPILRTVNYENQFLADVHYAVVDEKSIIAEPEDVIISRTGTVGRVLTGYRGIMHNNSFRLNYDQDKLIRKYLIYFLMSPYCQTYIVENSGRSSQPDLTHKAFSRCPISLPSREEQKEIVRLV
ncbi:restriction endonuclease subunit S, partial [Vibrio cholerae]|nr:restriction endonuclease subunit S [Vibrio cholerae]